MAEISWIKLSTGLPDNKKIKRIRKLPDGDKVILFWVFLLARAGESNRQGGLFLTDTLAYTAEDLAADFDFTIEFVKFSLITLEKYSMITRYDEVLFIKNWEEYQAIAGMEKVREKNRIRQARYREKQRQLTLGDVTSNTTSNGEVTLSNAVEIDIDKELDIDKEKDIKDISPSKKSQAKPVRHKYGEYQNVLLSDDDMEKLKKEFPSDWQERIERLSNYVASTGKSYKNHLATIRNWARKDKTQPTKPTYSQPIAKKEEMPDWNNKKAASDPNRSAEIDRMMNEYF